MVAYSIVDPFVGTNAMPPACERLVNPASSLLVASSSNGLEGFIACDCADRLLHLCLADDELLCGASERRRHAETLNFCHLAYVGRRDQRSVCAGLLLGHQVNIPPLAPGEAG